MKFVTFAFTAVSLSLALASLAPSALAQFGDGGAVNPFGGGSTHNLSNIQFDSNVTPELKAQVMNDIQFMTSVQGSGATAMHRFVFGAVSGSTYAQWLGTRIFSLGLNNCGMGNAVACVYPTIANKMFITPNYIKFDHPQIARLSVIYHEARHTENAHNNWPHATCPTPFKNAQGGDMRSIWTNAMLQGEPACDITPYGSYGSQTILLQNIALNCSNCSSKVKSDANLFAADQLGRIIDPRSHAAMKQDLSL
jgi:hypothetical protein